MYSVKKVEGTLCNEYMLSDGDRACAKIALDRGGILTSFVYDGKERIFMDPEFYSGTSTKLRGGNPILFPACGRLQDKTYTVGGKAYTMDTHGIARDLPWQVCDIKCEDAAELTVSLKASAESMKAYPFDFELRYTYRLKGNTISIIQDVINNSDTDMPFSSGMHPYFCADSNKASVRVPSKRCYFWGDEMTFDGVLDTRQDLDHVCVDLEGERAVLDTGLGYSVNVDYKGKYTCVVVWSPADYTEFVCVEPWTARPNALNTGEDLILLKPGGSERLEMSFEIE